MKKSSLALMILVVFILLLNPFSINNGVNSPKNQKRTNNLTIQIDFIGYDDEILDTSIFHELGSLNDYYPHIETIGR